MFSLMTVTSCNIGGIVGGFFGGLVSSAAVATFIFIIVFYQMKKIGKFENSHKMFAIYCISGNIGGDLNLAIWQSLTKLPSMQ